MASECQRGLTRSYAFAFCLFLQFFLFSSLGDNFSSFRSLLLRSPRRLLIDSFMIIDPNLEKLVFQSAFGRNRDVCAFFVLSSAIRIRIMALAWTGLIPVYDESTAERSEESWPSLAVMSQCCWANTRRNEYDGLRASKYNISLFWKGWATKWCPRPFVPLIIL